MSAVQIARPNSTTLHPDSNLRKAIDAAQPMLRGWSGKVERPHRMAQLILNERPKTVVEIGVFGGQSLVPMAMALKALRSGKIYGIDPFNLDVILSQMAGLDCEEMWLKQNMETVRNDTIKVIDALGLRHHVVLILAESKDCSTLFDSIDILHIDGAHTEEGALLDVNLYAKRVRQGGWVWLDDTHFPSLQPAMDELDHFCDMIEDWGGYRLYRHR